MRIGITERGDGGLQYERVLQALRSSEVDGAIIITKDPITLAKKVMDHGLPANTVVHCTITGYGGTFLEPHVPDPQLAMEAYFAFADMLDDPERLVLRVDPIVPTLKGISRALDIASGCKSRIRVSILDLYPHVLARIKAANPEAAKLLAAEYHDSIHAPILTRDRIIQGVMRLGFLDVEVCGEPGMECTGCVSARDIDAMGIVDDRKGFTSGQRKACACIAEKTELLGRKGRCVHGCLYCYWKD